MGSNRRYSEQLDRKMDQRIAESIMRDQEPASLSDTELALDVEDLTKATKPRPVRAWVRYGDVPLEVDGWAVAWTRRAVAVRWESPSGEHRAWVWDGAVQPREAP